MEVLDWVGRPKAQGDESRSDTVNNKTGLKWNYFKPKHKFLQKSFKGEAPKLILGNASTLTHAA